MFGLGFTLLAAGAMAQERPPYGQEIGVDLRGAVFISGKRSSIRRACPAP